MPETGTAEIDLLKKIAAPSDCLPDNVNVNNLTGSCGEQVVSLPPLTSGLSYTAASDITQTAYQTFLYFNGNAMPAAHRAVGESIAATVIPLNGRGQPSASGKILIIGEGISNAFYIFDSLRVKLLNSTLDNSKVVFQNLAEAGCDLPCWIKKGVGTIDKRVQVVLLYHSNNRPQSGCDKTFPAHAQTTQAQLKQRLQILKIKYPNLKLVYLFSRDFGGWTCPPSGANNREPVAYEEGFAIKWLIDGQILGSDPQLAISAVGFLAWGTYWWKPVPRSYYRMDGVPSLLGSHPCATGQAFYSQQIFDFLLTDSTTKMWFAR